jgi:Transglutaminase-like superfamily
VTDAIDYTVPGPLTDLTTISPAALEHIPSKPVDICRPVHTLVIQPSDAKALGLPDERLSENQFRPAAALVEALLALDPASLDVPRAPERRVVGTCRHFAVLTCALLRYRGIAARVRCGFATYFQPGQGLDHWLPSTGMRRTSGGCGSTLRFLVSQSSPSRKTCVPASSSLAAKRGRPSAPAT